MSKLSNNILISTKLRPCIVKGRKALFHKWSDKSKVIDPSLKIGGHDGGILNLTVGIIEYENGQVTECYPYEVKFEDTNFNEYCFRTETI